MANQSGPFPRLLTKAERIALKGPRNRKARMALREKRRWELWPEHGCAPWVYDLRTKLGPAILQALEALAIAAVRLVANDMAKSGQEKHAYATELVLDLAGVNRDDIADHAANLVHAAFDAARDAGEI